MLLIKKTDSTTYYLVETDLITLLRHKLIQENGTEAAATNYIVFNDVFASKASKIDTDDDCESEDRTLVDDLEIGDEERCESVVTHTDEALHFPEEEIPDAKNILVRHFFTSKILFIFTISPILTTATTSPPPDPSAFKFWF